MRTHDLVHVALPEQSPDRNHVVRGCRCREFISLVIVNWNTEPASQRAAKARERSRRGSRFHFSADRRYQILRPTDRERNRRDVVTQNTRLSNVIPPY
jgi:hypothetical protein